MLDIGFTELLLIAVIALVVLGPERLPGAVRSTAYWIGKLRRSFQNAKDELERELNVDEIKRQIHNETVMQELEKTKTSLNETLNQSVDIASDIADTESSKVPTENKIPSQGDSGDHSDKKTSAS